MTRGWAIGIGILVAILVPAGAYVGVQVYKLMSVCFGMVGYKIIGFNGAIVEMEIVVSVKNSSKLSVDIYGYGVDISLNGKDVARVASDKHKILDAGKTSNLVLPVKIDVLKSFGAVGSKAVLGHFLRNELDKIVVNLNGKFKASVLKVPVSIPIKMNYSLKEILALMNEPKTPC